MSAPVTVTERSIAVTSISGGKDSTAAGLKALQRKGYPWPSACRFAFVDTGNEHELTLEHVHVYLPTVFGPIVTLRAEFSRQIAGKRAYVERVWTEEGVPESIIRNALSVLQPTGNPFLDLCIWKGRFPSRKAQFCTQELKRRPLDDYMLSLMAEGSEVSSWRGIRRDESQNRSTAEEYERAAEGWLIVHPIVSWTAQQTIDFVRECGVRHNPLYSMGMGRVGCMPCINCNKDELLEISKRFPEHVARIREWERLVCMAAKRGWTTFFTDAAEDEETDAEIYSRLNIDSRIRWSKTQRGGRKTDWIKDLQPPPACSSLYGLCE